MAWRADRKQMAEQNTGQNVDRSRERLKVLPEDILKNPQINHLNFDRNRLKNVTNLSKLTKLKTLILSKNELVDFPEIGSLQYLEKLHLNQNRIQQIPEGILPRLPLLKQLKLNNNRLTDFPGDLICCKELQYLNLSHNVIKKIPKTIATLGKLEEFYIENNKLCELPCALFDIGALRKFIARANPLREPPDEVCAGGLQQIRSYFKQLQTNESLEDKRVKTMFLGASMAGKSTLCKSLTKQELVTIAENDRTIGIEINEFQTEDFSFLCWDFAGQLEYYLTHHVFITPQALVILVIDLHRYKVEDKDSFKELVGFWINNVLMRVPDSIVLPIGSHVDMCDKEEVQRKKKDIEEKIQEMLTERKENLNQRLVKLKEKPQCELYSDQVNKLYDLAKYSLKVLDLIPVDCTQYDAIIEAWLQILQLIRNTDIFPNVIRKLPVTYKMVEKAIMELIETQEVPVHGTVPLDELLTMINLQNIDREQLKYILSYLHRIGLIVWYQEVQTLEGTVFLKPSFLITLFKMIVRHDLLIQLNNIPAKTLKKESAVKPDQQKWITDFQTKATLHHKAIMILVKHQLKGNADLHEMAEDMLGDENGNGKLFQILEYFGICLSSKSQALNPDAHVFQPGSPWPSSGSAPPLTYLFPSYLTDAKVVSEQWKEESKEDLHIRAFFLPEIPQGFFHRVTIKLCNFIYSHWLGKERCLVVSNGRKLLLKEHNEEANSYIEFRCKGNGKEKDFEGRWCLLMMAIQRMKKVIEEWPGLHYSLKTPCRNPKCELYFDWPDEDIKQMSEETIKTCENCGRNFPTELLFYMDQGSRSVNGMTEAAKNSVAQQNIQNTYHVTGNFVSGSCTVNIEEQEFHHDS
ncbi:malignant fibrous histiocytoma-amplified sequence 1 homolog isoform X1 [Carcharodon carcharias]|uniref:malignant fibrous histiocytoma-amplified sequence 1 homolog isoform X1 n=1 Tax=Carcharodon carcharias TaxID=13397 RepID=UPI001B7F24E1|nr:malignant fibrous histiocytoma-amplified sequence 1 homolog isoform X1 [Carcharodon carcharias]